MKTKIFMASLMMASTLFSSCSDFLKEDPKGHLTAENYFNTLDELKMATVTLAKKAQATQIHTNMLYPQWQGDDITANPGSNKQACAEMDKFDVTDNNKGVNDAWNRNFTLIKAANYVINNASKTPTSQEEINIAIGQGKYWRAFAYFYLVRLFGPIPLNLDNTNDNYTATLTSEDKIYEQIVQDLLDAEEILPTSYKDAPRRLNGVDVYVTKQAATATLSAVYMAMAGYPLNKGTEYYAKAAEKAKEVIQGVKSGKYDFKLEDDYRMVYSMANNYNKETVLGINNSPVQDWAQDSEFPLCQLFESLDGWGDGWGEIRFWKRFPEGPRKDATYAKKIFYKGKLVDFWEKGSNDEGEVVPLIPEMHPMFCLFTLNADEQGNAILNATFDYTKPYNTKRMTNDHRHRVIRYSEVMLWYAESIARTGKVDDLAKECLRSVRKRAVNPKDVDVVNNVSIDAMTPEQFAEAAYQEHGWEVAGYWVAMVTRRQDQFRMNRLKDTFEERVKNSPIEVAPGVMLEESVKFTNKTWNDKLMYLPYPSSDAMMNPNLRR